MKTWIDRMSAIPWFASIGNPDSRDRAEALLEPVKAAFGLPDVPVRWLTLPEAGEFVKRYDITSSPMWPTLFELPERIRTAAERNGRMEVLSFAADDLPEAVFHAAFGGAFPVLQAFGQEAVRNAVCAAMYVSGLAAGWELAGEPPESNPLQPAIALFELGYWPLGLFEGRLCLL
ncbi:hypothetical protein [Cohnella caldifontis]|uniref:hypothetical protein n=1 Tax=Cohnella caldifontis TaxID=3027471 RepID=UPI0023EC4DF7|nr:hypothetical protein [Cohnella sp. YIM B05605]